jgi:hypothetical protein
MLWYAGNFVNGTAAIAAANICPADSVTTITYYTQGVANDGSEGYSSIKTRVFRRDGTATPVLVGSTTTIHEVVDSPYTPSCTIGMSGSDITVTCNSGSATTYRWTVWAEISTASV